MFLNRGVLTWGSTVDGKIKKSSIENRIFAGGKVDKSAMEKKVFPEVKPYILLQEHRTKDIAKLMSVGADL